MLRVTELRKERYNPFLRSLLIPEKKRSALNRTTSGTHTRAMDSDLDRNRLNGIIRLTAGASLISFSAVFVKLADVDPTVSAFYRMLFGGAILVGITWSQGKRLFCGWRHLCLLAAGGMFLALDLTLWHRSILYIGPGLATLLANFQVFFVAAVGLIFFTEKLTWKILAAIPLAIVGLYLIVGLNWQEFSPEYRYGVILGLFTALCYTGYIVFLRMAQMTASTFPTITLSTLFAALFLLMISMGHQESFEVLEIRSWLILIAYALVSQVFGWLLITSGIGRVEISKAGLILLLQPTLAFVWDVLLFARPITFVEVAGALLALFAIYLGTVGRVSVK
jgi:drug/metabolite transporter (DMT)-like permease